MHYLSSLLAQTIHALDTMPPGAAAGTITSDANVLQIGISEKLGTFVEFAAQMVTALVVAFVYSWRITLVTMCCIVFLAIVVAILLPFIIRGTKRSTRAETKAGAVATESFSAVRMIYACGAQARMAQRYARHVWDAKRHGATTAPLIALQFALMFFGMYSAFALCFWYGTREYARGEIDGIGTIVVVLLDVFLMTISLERMSGPLLAASKATVAAANFFAVIDAKTPEVGHLKEPDVMADGDIVFEDVTFAYPGRPSTKVLDALNLTIQAGKVTAIVGPSGSGKSTIVGLVEKWYSLHEETVIVKTVAKEELKKRQQKEKEKEKKLKEAEKLESGKKPFWARSKAKTPQSSSDDDDEDEDDTNATKENQDAGPHVQLTGKIMTSGHNLDDVNVKWWRSQIGLVQQEPFLFNQSIYENVMNGLIGTQWEHEPLETKQALVRDACKEAFADEFIEKMPQGYETQVGDQGLQLSGGQRVSFPPEGGRA